MFNYLEEKDYVEGLVHLIYRIEIMDLALIHIQALIDDPGMMCLDSGF